jgi:carboxymethylenebutenolidase
LPGSAAAHAIAAGAGRLAGAAAVAGHARAADAAAGVRLKRRWYAPRLDRNIYGKRISQFQQEDFNVTSKWIDLKAADGGTFQGYLALPPTGKGPGLLLIQEIFGVNQHIRGVADQYASDGFTVLAPDIFWRLQPRVDLGYGDKDMQDGIALMQKLDFAAAVGDIASAVKALRGRPDCSGKVASMGYCMGGLLSYLAAANAGVDAAVCYYGGGIHTQLAQADKVRVPILFHFADNDGYIPLSAVEAVQAAFKGHKDATVVRYPNVDHGFNCWDRGAYNQGAAARARGLSLEFLARTIA